MERIPIKQRDILLVPFPFSDQSGNKVRPVLVVSNNAFNEKSEDILVCAITSNMKEELFSMPITSSDLETGILHHTCCVKIENILKINKNLIIKKIGTIVGHLFKEIKEKIFQLF